MFKTTSDSMIGRLIRITRLAGVSLWSWLIPTIFTLIASALEGVSIGMLAPFIEMLGKKNSPEHVRDALPLSDLIRWIPTEHFHYQLLAVLGMICAVVTIKNVFMFGGELFVSGVSRVIEHRLRIRIYERFLSFGKQFFDRSKAGNLTDLSTFQVLVVANSFRFIYFLLSNALMSVVYLTLMLFISPQLTLSAVLFLPCIYAIISVFSKKIHASAALKFQIDQEMSSYLLDVLTNISLIKSSANEKCETARFAEISDRSRRNTYSIWKKIIFTPRLQETILTYATALLVAICALVFMRGDAFGIGAFLTFFIVLRRFAQTSGQVGINITEISRLAPSAGRILELFQENEKPYVRAGARPYLGLRMEIRFEDVEFGYDRDAPVLKKISLVFKKGVMTAVVGATGAGKTTIASLLMRFYDPTSGRILVDGIDIGEWDRASFLQRVAFVDQNASVLNATLRDNILYGHLAAVADDRLDAIARKASLHDFIQKLPQKYDTFIGDRGVRLSGGERQRLAIARAILKDPDIFIFDEATSSLDAETEQNIQSAIEEVSRGRTVVMIAHRLSTIKNADHIVVIEGGCVGEEGSFNELMARGGPFRRHWDLLLRAPQSHGFHSDSPA